jgi:hypothetical protein
VQPEHGAALRIAELGEPDLAVVTDGDTPSRLPGRSPTTTL